MSTRANYIFRKGPDEFTCLYIHHDGYPEGAAVYFQNALLFGNGRINSTTDFIRANEACEIETIHGDIEYLYEFDIQTQELSVSSRIYEGNLKFSEYITRMNIYEYINKHYMVFSSNPDFVKYKSEATWRTSEQNEQRVKEENTWVKCDKWICLALLYKELKDNTQKVIDNVYNYGIKNPNYETLLHQRDNLYDKLSIIMEAIKRT